jgi:hypothetical protein
MLFFSKVRNEQKLVSCEIFLTLSAEYLLQTCFDYYFILPAHSGSEMIMEDQAGKQEILKRYLGNEEEF